MKIQTNHSLAAVCGVASALVLAGAGALLVSRPAAATVQFATETGKSCGACHTAAAGGGALTPYGEKFKANDNKMPK